MIETQMNTKRKIASIARVILAVSTLLFSRTMAFSQVENPVSWSFSTEKTGDKTYAIRAKASFSRPWHLYSFDIGENGPVPTSLILKSQPGVTAVGKLRTSLKPAEVFDSMFMMDIKYFDKPVEFIQEVNVSSVPVTLTGSVEYMVCDNKRCLPPEQVEFSLKIRANEVNDKQINTKSVGISVATYKDSSPESGVDTNETVASREIVPAPASRETTPLGQPVKKGSLWLVFFGGLLGGLLAILTPCVFPMIPLTVSFFMKRGKKKNETWNVILYGLSIVVIYVGLGLLVTMVFGPDAMNALSTNPWFNVIFFLLLVVFATSFLGAFELTLPTSLANFFDRKADSTSGIVSIFFMAFTLGVVSFSCTGPIIGTLLVEAATSGSQTGPLVGMLGFSLALALPFTLFAFFPTWMQRLPKSGGWLNSVKVVLGFLELALALKFFSTADLAAHWNILPRETFLVLWIVIFAMLGFYLLGKIRLNHDDVVEHVGVIRLFLSIISLSFALYMVPGLWGAPLKAISAFSPPQTTQDFDLYTATCPQTQKENYLKPKRYGELFHCPLNLNCFFDYDEGMAYARQVGKPVILDFTGHGCVNCRKMEVSVWSDKRVLEILSQEYVLISLYVDDRTELPVEEQATVTLGGREKKLNTVGNKWSYFQASTFGTNSQPYYVLIDNNGKQLTQPSAFDLNVDNYLSFLEKGLETYKK